MREFDTPNKRSRLAKYRTLLVAACVVLVGGGVFAAGGGAEVVKRWFIQIQLYGPDGQVIDAVLEATDADGNVAVMDIDIGDGEKATVTVERVEAVPFSADSPDGEVDGEMSTVTVHIGASQAPFELDADAGEEGEPREIAITLSSEDEDGGDEMANVAHFGKITAATAGIERSLTVTNEIPEPDEVFEWTDDDGQSHEISVVRNYEDDPDGDGFVVYATLAEDAFLLVGALSVDSAYELEVRDFEVDEDGVGVVTFVDANGAEVLLEMRTLADDLDGLQITTVESDTEDGLRTIHLRKVEELRE